MWSLSHIALMSVVLTFSCACGGSLPSSTSALQTRLQTRQLQQVKKKVPDLVGTAENQLQLAIAAHEKGDALAASDYTAEAAMLVKAAIAEAQRVDLEEKRLATTRRWKHYEKLALHYEEQRQTIEHDIAQVKARAIAAQQIQQSLAVAVNEDKNSSAAEKLNAANVLHNRALLIAAAAQVLGADSNRIEPLLQRLESWKSDKNHPETSLAQADKTFMLAQRALAVERAKAVQPTTDQRASLQQALNEAGFDIESLEMGLATDFGRDSGAQHPQKHPESFEKWAKVVVAFPHGPIIVLFSKSNVRNATRADQIKNILTHEGIEGDRIKIEFAPQLRTEPWLVLPAY